jgi:hypothetical protein
VLWEDYTRSHRAVNSIRRAIRDRIDVTMIGIVEHPYVPPPGKQQFKVLWKK